MLKKIGRLAGGIVVLLACLGVTLSEAPHPVMLDENLKLVVEGEPFFPIGFYHVSWAGTEAERLEALETMAAAGFNVMHPALTLDDAYFLDRAYELGVYLIVEPYDDAGPLEVIEAFKNHPAIIGWLIADDFNSPAQETSPEHRAETHNEVKAISPNKLTYISGSAAMGSEDISEYMGITDLMGIQTYSVPLEGLDKTNRYLGLVQSKNVSQEQAIIANIQTYAVPGERPPTIDEVRSMTYQALLNGVSGVLYYTYFDDTWNLQDHPDLWAGMQVMAAELYTLTPVLLNGELHKVETGAEGAVAGYWVYDDMAYIAVVNTTYEETLEVELHLPFAPGEALNGMFEWLPNTFTYEEGSLRGLIGPAETQVFMLPIGG
jgi:hypothetical protein